MIVYLFEFCVIKCLCVVDNHWFGFESVLSVNIYTKYMSINGVPCGCTHAVEL